MKIKVTFLSIAISILCLTSCSITESMQMHSRIPIADIIADSEQYNTYYFGSSMALTAAILFIPKNSPFTVKVHPYWDNVPGGETVLEQMISFMDGANFTLRPNLFSITDKNGKFFGWIYNFPAQLLLIDKADENTVTVGSIYPTVYDIENIGSML